jgi:hypothetical protein
MANAGPKLGIVCEGQTGCAEMQILPKLVELICPSVVPDIVPCGNRLQVLELAPVVAQRLLNQGCASVIVMWDVFPEFRDQGGTSDCRETGRGQDDRQAD